MNRIDFIRSRMETWFALDKAVRQLRGPTAGAASRPRLLDFIKYYRRTIADLSLIRSLFPKDALIHELNALICRAVLILGRSGESDRSRLARFVGVRFPAVILRLRHFMLISALVFFGAAAFGFFLSMLNPFAANAMIGDRYVYMTIENIEKGTPFAVYKSQFRYAMSSFIMANNVRVGFMAFATGVLYGVGTFYILLTNGLMLGSVAAVFAHHGYLLPFFGTVMIHGTLELFAVVIAGAAGLRMGQSIFRPGQVRRIEALAAFGVEAFHLTVAMIPVFAIAAFLEGFVTPMELGGMSQAAIILSSALFLCAYMGLPIWWYRRALARSPESSGAPAIRTRY